MGPPRGRHAFGALPPAVVLPEPPAPGEARAPGQAGPLVKLIFADGTVESLRDETVRADAARLAAQLFATNPPV